MNATIWALILSAVSISFIHTASGPDHYLPFIVLSKSKKWSKSKTILLTIACGFGHVLSSLVLGAVGVFMGWQLNKFSWFQDIRGNISGWALLIFGVIYLIYGIIQTIKNKPHKHFDVLGDDVYVYEHNHGEVVMPQSRIKVTPFVLFMIFVMGPSEPLTPLLFYSGLNRSVTEIVALVVPFALTTVATMLGMVLLGRYGYSTFFNADKLERYMGVVSGAVVTVCGIGMVFLGW
jgi:sulfite exporter TauE/SafE